MLNTTELLNELASAPEYVNPAIALSLELMAAETSGNVASVQQAARSGAIERAVIEGEHEGNAVRRALAGCGNAIPQASKVVPVGF